MSDSRAFAADLLSGRRKHLDDRAPMRGPARAPDVVLDETRLAIDELEALRASDPEKALRVLREQLQNKQLTDNDLVEFIRVWRTAVEDPEAFENNVRSPTRGFGDWWDKLRAYLHAPSEADQADATKIGMMSANYKLPANPMGPGINPHERMLETLDPAWVPLLGAKIREGFWPKFLADMPRHGASQFTYTAVGADKKALAKGAPIDIALFADFGTGYYHSWAIAEQIAAWAFPYAFHLGDVYYAGRQDEFDERFEAPLLQVVDKTRLFGLAENHELYFGGAHYLEYFKRLREAGNTDQEGSYFCVRFPDHQVIGIDVNWQGRQRFTDGELQKWLRARLAEAGHRTNILLSGSAPFDYGDHDARKLLEDVRPLIADGSIGLWFWGDDHYCALFDRKDDEVPFFGSCIGHAGYPGPRQTESLASYKTFPLWFEDEPRFPRWTEMRQDMVNNGWCHARLQPGGGVDLVYVDWLSCKRAAISFTRHGARLERGKVETFDRETKPVRYSPT